MRQFIADQRVNCGYNHLAIIYAESINIFQNKIDLDNFINPIMHILGFV